MDSKKAPVLGGALLVAGTSIGAGMLALPIVSSQGGFIPALVVYLLCWGFMTATGLFFVELCLRMPPDTNLITLADHFLGKKGKVACWILYLFLFYSLSVAYLTIGGQLVRQLVGESLAVPLSSILFLLFFAPFIYRGAKIVDRLNIVLMAGLVISYVCFVVMGVGYVRLENLARLEWSGAFLALPVIFTAFSYQGVIPTLVTYLHRDKKRLKLAIIAGTTIAFFIYLLWQLLILGIIPVEGPFGLLEAKKQGTTAIIPLKQHTGLPGLYSLGEAFSFFAIATSFLGVGLGLFDCLADGLGVAKKGLNKLLIALLTFAPPLFVTLVNPGLFLIALSYAGGVGCALLLGLMPTLMAWQIRFSKGKEFGGVYRFPLGKSFFFILFGFVLFELGIELIQEWMRIF
jgi:tyrosine-specific transport protein